MSFGSRVKEAREQLKLDRDELAKKAGVTVSAISNYENEISHPKETVMYKLIDALEVDANFLFQDEVNIYNKEQKKEPTLGSLEWLKQGLKERGFSPLTEKDLEIMLKNIDSMAILLSKQSKE